MSAAGDVKDWLKLLKMLDEENSTVHVASLLQNMSRRFWSGLTGSKGTHKRLLAKNVSAICVEV
jgi:hypothetical protein